MNKDKYTLQEVTTPAVEREWLDLPKKIYKGNRNWVCPLDMDVLEVFNPAKNELFADGEAIRWVVRDRQGAVVGRIAAFYNREKPPSRSSRRAAAGSSRRSTTSRSPT